MEGGVDDMSGVSELVEGARRVVPASSSPSADVQQQGGMTVVPALFPVLPAPSWSWGWECLQPSQRRCVEEQGGAAESPLKWEKGA